MFELIPASYDILAGDVSNVSGIDTQLSGPPSFRLCTLIT